MQSKFLTMLRDLPTIWQSRHDPKANDTVATPSFSGNKTPANHSQSAGPPSQYSNSRVVASTTPASTNMLETPVQRNGTNGKLKNQTNQTMTTTPRAQSISPHSLIPSTPTTSHNEQLTAAILEGDIQGIRTIIRSKGDDLTSDYWINNMGLSTNHLGQKTSLFLPLHRAISGLHFHGSGSLLVATLTCLHQLGAEMNLTDPAGNTVLHKAIQVQLSYKMSVVLF